VQEQIDRLKQELHELRSDHIQDVKDLNQKVLDLGDHLAQEETDREQAITSLEDRVSLHEGG